MYTSAGRRLIPALCPLAAGRVSVLGSLRCESSHTSQSASTGSGQVKSDKSTLELERDKFGHPRMPHRGYFEEDKCDERREWMENVTGTRLDYIGDWWTVDGQRNSEAREKFPTTTLKGNVENAIGMQTIPVGATGPLLVRGHHTNNSVVVPYATLEPGVCASATRGARVLTLSGGVVARVTGVGQRRSPAFYFDSMAESRIFAEWIKDQVPAIRASMKEVSQHGKLQKVQPIIQGRGVTVNCLFVTGDAAGQNMVTSLTNNAYKWIARTVRHDLKDQVTLRKFVIEDLFSGDKRGLPTSCLLGRGIAVQAEAYIPNSLLEKELKVGAERLAQCFELCSESIIKSCSNSITLSSQDSLPAIFTATGQDVACILESTHGNTLSVRHVSQADMRRAREREALSQQASKSTTQELKQGANNADERGLYICLNIPVLPVGTVGGGTMLPTQKECLSMMGCFGSGGSLRFAEITAASALGLELSVLASLACGHSRYSLEDAIHDKILGQEN